MKKLGFLFKEVSASRISESVKSSSGIFIVNFSGLSSPDLTTLRQALISSKASLFVVKNSVARRVFKDLALESLVKSLTGPCGLIFIKDEPVDASRALCDFSRAHEQLKLEGGFFEDKILEKKDIEYLASLPSKEILRAQAVTALKSPITGLVFVLKGNLRKLVYCLEQVKGKKAN